jgi:hypothetical protein
MPTPDPNRRPIRRPAGSAPPPKQSGAEPTPRRDPPSSPSPQRATPSTGASRPSGARAGAAARTSAARRHAETPPKRTGVILAMCGSASLLALLLWFVLRDHSPKKKSELAVAPTPVVEAPPAVVEPAPAPKPPPPPPPPSAATVRKKLTEATTGADAAAVARDAERTNDAALIEEAWTRVHTLDPDEPTAREKLDVRRLEPAKELEGFAAIGSTPQKIHLKPFYDEAREETTKAQRKEIAERWATARAEIEARIEKAKTIPFYREVDEFRAALAQKPFFSDLQYEMLERPPYALFVEVEGKPEERAKRRKDAETAYGPYLDAYDKKIRSYLFPLSPKPPKEDPLFPVFVFLRVERYRDYSIADHGAPPAPGMRAHYEPGKKQCFTYSPVLKPGFGQFQEGTQSLLHELTHAWVDQLASADGGESRSIEVLRSHWFSEGIAEYMSCQFEHVGEIRFQPWRSNRVGGSFHPPGWRIPIRKALEIPMHGLDAEAFELVKDMPPDKRDEAVAAISSGFYADMSNFILWLNLRSGANRSKQFEAYAREEMAGNGGYAAFQRCFPGLTDEVKDFEATIDDFVKRIANGKINPYKEAAELETPANASSGK